MEGKNSMNAVTQTGEADWDYIIVGAGSAGCAMAARLSAAGKRILLLEAGTEDRGRWLRIPLGLGKIIRDERYVWMFETEPEAATKNRRMFWPRGKLLGGSSSVNGMIWATGEPAKYDEWEAAGCQGWGWSAMEPIIRASESYSKRDAPNRGHGGPIAVEELGDKHRMTDAFIDACVSVGIPFTPDYNGRQTEGVGRLQLSTRRGVRCSTAEGYLRPALMRPNLRVETGALVQRVVFEATRAVGVEYEHQGQRRMARSRFDVILAAGAIQSPQLLELSGIGDQQRLRDLSIPVVMDLPGVGENLSDHYHIRMTFKARDTVTVNDLLRLPWWHGPRGWLEYQALGTGIFANATATAHALARTHEGATFPDMKLQLHTISSADRTAETKGLGVDPYCGASIGFFQLYPESRGSVHITSIDPTAPPRIFANYLGAAADRAAVIRGQRLARKIAAIPRLHHFLSEETRPGPEAVDDEALLDYARREGQTSYHPVGTCRMGNTPDCVVDAECRVRGVSGLRVADASVMPFIVSSNTNAPSIAVGEKVARDLLAQSNEVTQLASNEAA